MGEAPSLRAEEFQVYILFIPGGVVPANLGTFKGSQGRRHITRGNKNLGHLGPRFASHSTYSMLAVRQANGPSDGSPYLGARSSPCGVASPRAISVRKLSCHAKWNSFKGAYHLG